MAQNKRQPNPTPVILAGTSGNRQIPTKSATVDGGNVSMGATTDTPATDNTSAWTLIALFKGLFKWASAGQKLMASSAPVVIASNQSSIPVSYAVVSGTWNYVAATLTGAGNVTGVGRCIGIRVYASGADGTFNINAGNTITIRSGNAISIDPRGNLTAPVINWVSGTLDVCVQGVS